MNKSGIFIPKIFLLLGLIVCGNMLSEIESYGQDPMTNVSDRKCTSLNGKWQVIIDPMDVGNWRQVWKEQKPLKKTDFFEYSFEGGPELNVPGDFNSQLPELSFYEGTVWYKKTFKQKIKDRQRLFLHFGAVNYLATIYLNGKQIGTHEGGFAPFQIEITNEVVDTENALIVRVNNQRLKDGVPGRGFDWLNYGGITRDVNLIVTENTFIEDYFIRLNKHSVKVVDSWVKLNGNKLSQEIRLKIPELDVNYKAKSNVEGIAELRFIAEFIPWSPENPKLYQVIIESETDTVYEEIGFRTIDTKGPQILLNGKPIFLKGINIHEENPLKASRASSKSDALLLLTWAKELGCNFIRLSHYPHSEYMVKEAERMGLMVWDEIPVYQHIEFASPGVTDKISFMLAEMIHRDKNRCGVIIWSISNETYPSTPGRNEALVKLSKQCRLLDPTRLVASAFCNQSYENNTIFIRDTLNCYFDVISINEYLGWYVPWQGPPNEVKWNLACNDKPLIISEFGGEALFGNNTGQDDEAAFWNEGYLENIYKNQVEMFKSTPNLCGVCPWLLVDYRSPGRMHPVYQNGWNRKGLLSDKGEKKKAWYVMKQYYEGHSGQ